MEKQLKVLKLKGYEQTDMRTRDQVYYFKKDKIILWVKLIDKELVVKDLWYNSGTKACPTFDGRILTEEILNEIEEKENKKICSDCGKEVEEYAGSHFAGHYCEKCWDIYKKKHNGNCSLCGKFYYECCC
jgi:hypothetical protein